MREEHDLCLTSRAQTLQYALKLDYTATPLVAIYHDGRAELTSGKTVHPPKDDPVVNYNSIIIALVKAT